MYNAKNHPTPAALRRSTLHPDPGITRHLGECKDCRLVLQTLRGLEAVTHSTRRQASTESLVQSILSLPALSSGPTRAPKSAPLIRDSWQPAMVAQFRHAAHGVERRLRFRVGDLTIDLVADRLGDKWNCSMRISRKGRPVSHFAAGLGKKKMLPVDTGFFSWISTHPPKQIRLWSSEIDISLETIPW